MMPVAEYGCLKLVVNNQDILFTTDRWSANDFVKQIDITHLLLRRRDRRLSYKISVRMRGFCVREGLKGKTSNV